MDKLLEQRLDQLDERIAALAKRPRITTMTVNLSYTVDPLVGVSVEEHCPVTGEAVELLLGFPDGCQDLVDLKVSYKGFQVYPSEGTVALNDASPVVKIKRFVEKGQPFRAEIDNYDDTYEHHITVIAVVEGVGGE